MRKHAPPDSADDLTATAYHEAGHAVAYLRHNIRFRLVSIVPDEDSAGRVVGQGIPKSIMAQVNDDRLTPRARDRLERELVSRYAGQIAQELVAKDVPAHEWEQDRFPGVELVLAISGSPAEAEAYVSWLYERARSLVAVPCHRSCIEAIARALVECRELSYDECIAVNQRVLTRGADE